MSLIGNFGNSYTLNLESQTSKPKPYTQTLNIEFKYLNPNSETSKFRQIAFCWMDKWTKLLKF